MELSAEDWERRTRTPAGAIVARFFRGFSAEESVRPPYHNAFAESEFHRELKVAHEELPDLIEAWQAWRDPK